MSGICRDKADIVCKFCCIKVGSETYMRDEHLFFVNVTTDCFAHFFGLLVIACKLGISSKTCFV